MNYDKIDFDILKVLKEQGRTQVWLANRLDITTQTLRYKIKDNKFRVAEVSFIKGLLGI